ncbi:hypothetical protein ACFLSI_00690 [Bacteroidota bacterium]
MNITDLFLRIFNKSKNKEKKVRKSDGPVIIDKFKKQGKTKTPALELELMKSTVEKKIVKVYDVRKKMIEATRIKREEGYESAIIFLKKVAEECLMRQLSDLVLCVNKLIPYMMKKDIAISYKETCEYLDDILERMPRDDGYYLNLFITKAGLIHIKDEEKAVNYLEKILNKYRAAKKNINFYLKLAEYNILLKRQKPAEENINKARELLKTKRERYSHIRKQKKWHGLSKLYALNFPEASSHTDFLYHTYLEFLMSICLITSPQNAKLFRHFRENYTNGTWKLDRYEKYNEVLEKSGLLNKKTIIHNELYDYAFNTMPEVIGVTKQQLAYVKGEPESIEEIRKKKVFPKKQFVEFYELDKFTKQLILKYQDN